MSIVYTTHHTTTGGSSRQSCTHGSSVCGGGARPHKEGHKEGQHKVQCCCRTIQNTETIQCSMVWHGGGVLWVHGHARAYCRRSRKRQSSRLTFLACHCFLGCELRRTGATSLSKWWSGWERRLDEFQAGVPVLRGTLVKILSILGHAEMHVLKEACDWGMG